MTRNTDAPARPGWKPVPKDLTPMLATLGELPPPAQDSKWAYEMKWDGMRALLRVEGGRITVISRNARDVTVGYPELTGLGEALGSTELLLDGEIVSLDDRGRPDFGRMQRRMHVSSASEARTLSKSFPVLVMLFDLLHLDGQSMIDLAYTTRREELTALGLNGVAWQTPQAFSGSGAQAQQTSLELGLEGVMAKRLDSRYWPGRRTKDWIKVKNSRMQEVVVGGWTPGKGMRADTIGALLLGIPRTSGENGLQYVGKVGTGFNAATLDDLLARLRRLSRKTSPFEPPPPRADARDAQWVTPKLVAEVAFSEWTSDRRLRHPSWRGLRPDKDVSDLNVEG